MGMNPGPSSKIEFVASDNRPRVAWLTAPEGSQLGTPLQNIQDCRWVVYDPETHEQATFDAIKLIVGDGSHWWAEVECNYGPGSVFIHSTFLHGRLENDHEHRDTKMGFIDWERRKWIAELEHTSNHVPPRIILRHDGW